MSQPVHPPERAPGTAWPRRAGAQPKEAHKIFDEVFINVKSGDGGQGEIVATGTGRWVRNLKYKAGGNMRKQIWLPSSKQLRQCTS